MKNLYLIILLFSITRLSFGQEYNVSIYQKINEIQGSFTGNLENEDSFGVSIDNIGDLDGNGINDIAVGAFSDDDGGANRGAVWILFLDSNDLVVSHTKISNTSGGFTGVLDNDDRFGGSVSFLGDLNNDGLIEIAVGADYDGDGGFWHGAVWILSLNTNGTVNSYSKISDLEGGFTGFINGDAIFGTDIENIGDLNGDGIIDLAVGSRRDNDGGGNGGAVWILFLNSDFTVISFQKISDTQGNFTAGLDFEDYFGGSVANIGDLNGDGVVDLVVGTYRDDDGSTNSGSFYVLFLNTDGTVNGYQKVSNIDGGLSTFINSNALFGESIDGVVDIDNDGKIEIIVGAMKQNNPTLGTATGGFFIVELNSDGTVSDENFYSYNENCFSGVLEDGDLFGGAVCLLSDDPNNVKIAVGAYRDSENGYRKGAAWILNLRDTISIIETFTDPTTCGSEDGEIVISGLIPNTTYTIAYNYEGTPILFTTDSDSTGAIVISGLSSGNFTAIVVTQDNTGCTDNLGNVDLSAQPLMANISFTDPATCGSADGEIVISGLFANTTYTVEYNYEGTPILFTTDSDSTGAIVISGLSSGNFTTILVTQDIIGCTDNLGNIELSAQPLMANISFTDPTTCGSADGEIVISGLFANTTYTVEYNYEGTPILFTTDSDSTGAIVISGLSSGNFTTILVTQDIVGCTDNLGNVELSAQPLMANISFTDPATCGSADGEIVISGLFANTTYTIEYNYEGTPIIFTTDSDSTGAIVISGLSSGNFTTILVTQDIVGCTDNLGNVELSAQPLMANISFTDPATCGSADGEIVISGLFANTTYTIEYNYEGTPIIFTTDSDSTGAIVISGLSSGNFTTILVTQDIVGCTDNLGNIELSAQPLMANISFTDPATCGSADGEIVISGLFANTTYTIEYNYEGTPIIFTTDSDSTGAIVISGLSSGNYTTILVTQDGLGCTDNLGNIELSAQSLMVNTSFTDPASCDNSDGTITFSELSVGLTYTINYNYNGSPTTLNLVSDTNGEIIVTGLDSGTYSNIVVTETILGCADTLNDVILTPPDLVLIIESSDPTSCDNQDGIITISGLTAGLIYSVEYEYESTLETLVLEANSDGYIHIIGLNEGQYFNILITEDITGCDFLWPLEILSCDFEAVSENCFKVKKYFTPNNDGYNDYWFLETDSLGCNYALFIFDRYGKLLKTLSPQSNKWDGTYRGVEMPSDDYWFLVEYVKLGEQLELRSHFTLKR